MINGGIEQLRNVQLAIISSANDFYRRMKILEANNFPRNRIIDGRVFQVPELNLPRLLAEGVAYGRFEDENYFSDITNAIYPRIYIFKNSKIVLRLGRKSRINGDYNLSARLETLNQSGIISFGNFSAMSWNALFQLGINVSHNPRNVHMFALSNFDWTVPNDFWPKNNSCKILVGNDVWIGRGCILKCTNPNKPLVIGDGAVIASDSVVVKNVPPYAIVGGNPAKIIKYRFSEDVIEAFQRIKWWDWSIDKIHDNFKYFNDIDKFIALHDKT